MLATQILPEAKKKISCVKNEFIIVTVKCVGVCCAHCCSKRLCKLPSVPEKD